MFDGNFVIVEPSETDEEDLAATKKSHNKISICKKELQESLALPWK